MFGLSWRRSLLVCLLMAFVLQGVVSMHASFSSAGHKQSVSHAGHVHSPAAAAPHFEVAEALEPAASKGPESDCHAGGPCCPACIAVAFSVSPHALPERGSTHFPELVFHHRSPTLSGLDRPPQLLS